MYECTTRTRSIPYIEHAKHSEILSQVHTLFSVINTNCMFRFLSSYSRQKLYYNMYSLTYRAGSHESCIIYTSIVKHYLTLIQHLKVRHLTEIKSMLHTIDIFTLLLEVFYYCAYLSYCFNSL